MMMIIIEIGENEVERGLRIGLSNRVRKVRSKNLILSVFCFLLF